MYTAFKVSYDRKTKNYNVESQTVEAGDVIAALNSGYTISDDLNRTLADVKQGRIFNHNPKQTEAVTTWLKSNLEKVS